MTMTFLEMCLKTNELAKAHDKPCRLYEMPDGTLLASLYYLDNRWLYMAYPGGRTVLSKRGELWIDLNERLVLAELTLEPWADKPQEKDKQDG